MENTVDFTCNQLLQSPKQIKALKLNAWEITANISVFLEQEEQLIFSFQDYYYYYFFYVYLFVCMESTVAGRINRSWQLIGPFLMSAPGFSWI